MIGIITAIKSERMRGSGINCVLKFETIISMEEYNNLVKAFEENTRYDQGAYKMSRDGRWIKLERTDK